MKRDDALLKLAATMASCHPVPRESATPVAHFPGLTTGQTGQTAHMDLVCIDGFEGQTVIGLDQSEWHAPQPLRIDVLAGVPRSRACATDRIGDTIDYGEVRTALRQLMQTHRLQLLEAFAEQVAQMLLGQFGAHWVRVKVVKPRKFDDVEAVGVVIERRRESGRSVMEKIGGGMVVGA